MTALGLNITTARAVDGLDHLRQSVRDILTTPLGIDVSFETVRAGRSSSDHRSRRTCGGVRTGPGMSGI